MSALLIASGSKADGTDGLRGHVIGMLFVGLHVSPKIFADMLFVIQVYASHDEPWRMMLGGASLWDKRVNPKNNVTDEMNKHDLWNAAEGQGMVCGARAVFDRADAAFNSRDVVVAASGIERWVALPNGVEFGVGTLRSAQEPASAVLFLDGFDSFVNGFNFTVRKGRDSDETEVLGKRNEERHFVDKEDVDGEDHVLIPVVYWSRHSCNSSGDVRYPSVGSFSFESGNARAIDLVGNADVVSSDRTAL
mgnify:CR=1 FL=1